MRILFNDVVKNALIASTNASGSYPADNLGDEFLRLRYQVDGTYDSITVTLEEAATIDSVWFGYMHNVDSLDVTFHDGGGTEIGAAPFGDYNEESFTARHFDPVSGVEEIRVEIGGTAPFFIGGMGAGEALAMPAAVAAWDDGYIDNSVMVRSSHGQMQQQYIEPYTRYAFAFTDSTLVEFLTIKSAAANVGKRPVWATLFELSMDTYPPGYYSVELRSAKRERMLYRFDLVLEEAR